MEGDDGSGNGCLVFIDAVQLLIGCLAIVTLFLILVLSLIRDEPRMNPGNVLRMMP